MKNNETTLIERLQSAIYSITADDAHKAADEIKRLQEKIETLDADVRAEQIWVKYWHSQVALLREALQKIVDTSPIDFNYDANEIANHQWNLALATLDKTGETK